MGAGSNRDFRKHSCFCVKQNPENTLLFSLPSNNRLIHNRKLPHAGNLHSNKHAAPLAQWIRRLPTEQEILGSIPGEGRVGLNFVIHQTAQEKLNASA